MSFGLTLCDLAALIKDGTVCPMVDTPMQAMELAYETVSEIGSKLSLAKIEAFGETTNCSKNRNTFEGIS